jgi:dihydroorotate dehydrogenase (NAD+) catalytic subunit
VSLRVPHTQREVAQKARFSLVRQQFALPTSTDMLPAEENLRVSRLAVTLNRLQLANPILVASGTFGYAREMQAFVPFAKLGGIIPKTVTPLPRLGNPPPRTVETAAGLLNSIGLDNDGLDAFLEKHLPYLLDLGTSIIVNIAGGTIDEFVSSAARLDAFSRIAALELNISCPNVSHGVDFGIEPNKAAELVKGVRGACRFPIIAKLTPNVTDIVPIARAVAEAGADAVSLVNTFQGLAVDWRRRRPILGGGTGGLSGPAIKPLALRCVWQVARAVKVPIIGVGGVASLNDVMDYLVCGASAVQVGTANFYDPGAAPRLVDELEHLVEAEGWTDLTKVFGTLQPPKDVPPAH